MMPKKTTVTLEDLIRLKRSERPPTEFWAEFDRDLRAKQLAAIVEPRPWWASFIRVGAKVSHYQLPMGPRRFWPFPLSLFANTAPSTSVPHTHPSPK